MTNIHPHDAQLDIHFDDLHVHAFATFYPARNGGQKIDKNYIQALLDKENVVHGINWEGIQEAVSECNGELKVLSDILIASGELPINSAADQVIINHKRFDQNIKNNNQQHINYRRISRLPLVRKGEHIGTIIQKEEKSGIDVHGNSIPPQSLPMKELSLGKNIRVEDNDIFAARSGLLTEKDNAVSIEEKLIIKGDVDYHTGNIYFPGNVSVKGKIHDLFSLKVGGDLTFDSTIDAWEIFCKGNLFSKAGLIGKGKRHLARIKGRVNLKFIENCSLESLATIYIQRSCMNAFVATTDRICLGKGGKIVASEVYAGGGVYADELGNRAGKPCKIVCGMNYIVDRKLKEARKQLGNSSKRLRSLERSRKVGEETDHDRQKYSKKHLDLTEKIEDNSNRMQTLIDYLDLNEEAEVIVRGRVYPDVTIQICRANYTVTEEHHSVRFYLDKELGRIVMEPLRSDRELKNI